MFLIFLMCGFPTVEWLLRTVDSVMTNPAIIVADSPTAGLSCNSFEILVLSGFDTFRKRKC